MTVARRQIGFTAAALSFAFFSGCGSSSDLPENPQLFVAGRDGSGLRQLTHGDRFHGAAAWSPDGRLIASRVSSVRHKDGEYIPTPGAIEVIAVGGSRTRLLRAGGSASSPAWQHEGRRLAFLSRRGPLEARTTIVVMSLGARVLKRTPIGLVTPDVAWSPDGGTLAFVRGTGAVRVPTSRPGRSRARPKAPSRIGPEPDIFLIRSNGGGERRLTRSAAEENDVAWSRDQKTILFVRGRGRSLWRVSRDGAGLRRLAGRLIIAFPASPSGRRVVLGAVTVRGDRRFHLYSLSASGGPPRALTGEVGTQPAAWSPDGGLIAFVNGEGDAVMVMRPDGADQHTIARVPGAEIHDLSWSPDGRRLAFTASRKPRET